MTCVKLGAEAAGGAGFGKRPRRAPVAGKLASSLRQKAYRKRGARGAADGSADVQQTGDTAEPSAGDVLMVLTPFIRGEVSDKAPDDGGKQDDGGLFFPLPRKVEQAREHTTVYATRLYTTDGHIPLHIDSFASLPSRASGAHACIRTDEAHGIAEAGSIDEAVQAEGGAHELQDSLQELRAQLCDRVKDALADLPERILASENARHPGTPSALASEHLSPEAEGAALRAAAPAAGHVPGSAVCQEDYVDLKRGCPAADASQLLTQQSPARPRRAPDANNLPSAAAAAAAKQMNGDMHKALRWVEEAAEASSKASRQAACLSHGARRRALKMPPPELAYAHTWPWPQAPRVPHQTPSQDAYKRQHWSDAGTSETKSQVPTSALTLQLDLGQLRECADSQLSELQDHSASWSPCKPVAPLSLLAAETAQEQASSARRPSTAMPMRAEVAAAAQRPSTAGVVQALVGTSSARGALGAMESRRALHEAQLKSARGVTAHWRQTASSPRPLRRVHEAHWNKTSVEIGLLSDWRPQHAVRWSRTHTPTPREEPPTELNSTGMDRKVSQAIMKRHARRVVADVQMQAGMQSAKSLAVEAGMTRLPHSPAKPLALAHKDGKPSGEHARACGVGSRDIRAHGNTQQTRLVDMPRAHPSVVRNISRGQLVFLTTRASASRMG